MFIIDQNIMLTWRILYVMNVFFIFSKLGQNVCQKRDIYRISDGVRGLVAA